MKFARKGKEFLARIMSGIADGLGRPIALVIAVGFILIWFITKRFIEYNIWFDIMDVTIFLTMFVFLFVIQSSQNAYTKAIQDKLDELIEAMPKARSSKKGEEKLLKQGKLK